jgi:hypothetical protein
MKKFLILVLYGLLYQGSMAQQARNITDVNNKSTPLDSLQGAKLLIIVLPLQTDTALNNQLIRFQKTYAQKVKVVALVNVQPGTPSKENYASTYDEASRLGIIVTEGIKASEKAENERASIIQWMTGRSNSRQQDRYAVGSKFFLSEEGRMYAQLGKATSLDDPIVKCIINTKVPATKMPTPKTQKP